MEFICNAWMCRGTLLKQFICAYSLVESTCVCVHLVEEDLHKIPNVHVCISALHRAHPFGRWYRLYAVQICVCPRIEKLKIYWKEEAELKLKIMLHFYGYHLDLKHSLDSMHWISICFYHFWPIHKARLGKVVQHEP